MPQLHLAPKDMWHMVKVHSMHFIIQIIWYRLKNTYVAHILQYIFTERVIICHMLWWWSYLLLCQTYADQLARVFKTQLINTNQIQNEIQPFFFNIKKTISCHFQPVLIIYRISKLLIKHILPSYNLVTIST